MPKGGRGKEEAAFGTKGSRKGCFGVRGGGRREAIGVARRTKGEVERRNSFNGPRDLKTVSA